MKYYNSKYGKLGGFTSVEAYPDGQIKDCILEESNIILTPYGKLVPQFEQDGVRRKYTYSLSFYKDGNIKGISLNDQTEINTRIGVFEAEKITFYENGSIKRLFPLNGKISGYWTEENEYDLAKEYVFESSLGTLRCKVISIQFYENESLKSITLWPNEILELNTADNKIKVRTGISFYENGSLKSCEPAEITPVNTAIGTIMAYDTNFLGIHGERNSLVFDKSANVKSLISSTDKIEVVIKNKEKVVYIPGEKTNLFNNFIKDIVPLKIEFLDKTVRINGDSYLVHEASFKITNNFKKIKVRQANCSSCELKNSGIEIVV